MLTHTVPRTSGVVTLDTWCRRQDTVSILFVWQAFFLIQKHCCYHTCLDPAYVGGTSGGPRHNTVPMYNLLSPERTNGEGGAQYSGCASPREGSGGGGGGGGEFRSPTKKRGRGGPFFLSCFLLLCCDNFHFSKLVNWLSLFLFPQPATSAGSGGLFYWAEYNRTAVTTRYYACSYPRQCMPVTPGLRCFLD